MLFFISMNSKEPLSYKVQYEKVKSLDGMSWHATHKIVCLLILLNSFNLRLIVTCAMLRVNKSQKLMFLEKSFLNCCLTLWFSRLDAAAFLANFAQALESFLRRARASDHCSENMTFLVPLTIERFANLAPAKATFSSTECFSFFN